jgi:hypothetical protein
MKTNLLVLFTLLYLKLYAQSSHVQMIKLSKQSIEFYYRDTLTSTKKYKRVYSSKHVSYYKVNNEKVFINPFAGMKEDSTSNKTILDFIKSKYDYKKSKKRQTFTAPVEVISIALNIGVNGKVINWGLIHQSNVPVFEKEIFEILPALKSQADLPIYKTGNKTYPYLKTYQFSNYDLYKQ